jgi:Big-like domain-containing protein
MTSRRLAPVALACAALTLLPAAAGASTWTVDDDRVDCPNAGFTSIQAAVEQAAPWETVIVCAGLSQEQSTPTSGNNSPSQPGSQNGLTITKPLTIRGAGPTKVTIRPAPAAGPTLAGTAPFLRDAGGNVVTIARQAGGSSDDNENFVDISGVTIDSPTTYAEAGVAFFNTSGRVANSVIGPLQRAADATELAARPHGWGVVQTNSLQGTEAGVRRQVTIERSVVLGYQSGGVLFDDARGPDGAEANSVRSGIVAYGYVIGSRIEGSGSSDVIPQTGIRYHAGARGYVIDSDIANHSFASDPRQSVGLLLTDAHTTADPSNPATRGFYAINNRFTGNGYALFNADMANAAVREGAPAQATPGTPGAENWWGCGTGPIVAAPSTATCQGISGPDGGGAQSIERGANRTAMQILPAPPEPTPDAVPAGAIAEPLGEAIAGEDAAPVVVASDDFGVKSVALTVDGVPLATDGRAPYEFAWTPGFAQIGDVVTLAATITDSSDQATVVTTAVEIAAPAGYAPITVGPLALDAGAVLLGASAQRAVTVTNSGENALTLDALDIAGAGFARVCAGRHARGRRDLHGRRHVPPRERGRRCRHAQRRVLRARRRTAGRGGAVRARHACCSVSVAAGGARGSGDEGRGHGRH